jgi:hypothetical protein
MPRPYDRPATLTAIVNAVLVYILPVATVMILMVLKPNQSIGATVVGVDPDRVAANTRKLQMIAGYLGFMSPFAMAAAWRTFVHATRWLEFHDRTWWGVLEGGVLGFAGMLLLFAPGILIRPQDALPAIAYAILVGVMGLIAGFILRLTALATLKLVARPA